MRPPRNLEDAPASRAADFRFLFERLRTARVDPTAPPPFAHAQSEPAVLWSAALVEAWAEVMAILLFYQERIRAEGYLGTAVETLSRRLLEAGVGLERRAVPLPALQKPGRPIPLVLDPGCAASADFILRLRAAPGLPDTTWLPAGAQFRHHASDAPSVAVFESDAPVSLKAAWNDLPLMRRRTRMADSLATGTPGVLLAAGAALPRPGDHLLLSAREDPAVFAFRQAATVVPNGKAGTCEVIFDRPIDTEIPTPRAELLGRRTALFGWNAGSFAALPEAARRRAVRGREDSLAGGLRLVQAGACEARNVGFPEGEPRALAVATDGTVYLATDGVWRGSPRTASGARRAREPRSATSPVWRRRRTAS